MPILCEFDTGSVRSPPANSRPDTWATINFPRSFVALPRVPHGFRLLDIDKKANIRAKSTIHSFTKHWADCHITTWYDSVLHYGVDHIFVRAPNNLDFLTGERIRHLVDPASVRVNFERPFVTPPKVVVFFNYIDLDKDHHWRLKVTATDIDANGFTLGIETWSDTILYAAQACWIAYPEDREHIFSASVDTTEVRPLYRPQLQQSKAIEFNGVEFWKNPSVFVALNSFDIDCKANFRIKAYVDNVSKTGLIWHLDSWYDTILYSAGASIIAFN